MDPHIYDQELLASAVGRRLSLVRQVLGLSQADFAAGAQIKPNAWNNYESGRSRIGPDAAARVCAVYGVDLNYIYLGDTSHLPYRIAHALDSLRRARGSG